MIETVRVVALRRPSPAESPSIALAHQNPFQGELRAEAARRGPNLRAIVRRWMTADPARFVTAWDGDALGLQALLPAAVSAKVAGAELPAFAQQHFQNTFPLFTDAARRNALAGRLADSTVAAYILLDEYPLRLGDLSAAVRALHVIRDSTILVSWSDADLAEANVTPLVLPLTAGVGTEVPALGVMDLMSLRHHVIAYAPHDISEIENVLAGETRVLNQRNTVTTERETTEETARDTETSEETGILDRFSFKREVEQATKEELAVKAGLDVGYGSGGFHLSAQFGVDFKKSKEQIVKDAVESAKEITRKSAQRVSERFATTVRRAQTIQTERVENHTQTNTNSDVHLTGVYRWVHATHECGLFLDPARAVVDLMVPEPAALLRWLERKRQAAVPSRAPRRFTRVVGDQELPVLATNLAISPEVVAGERTEYYGRWVAEYGANVPPLPEATVTVGRSHAGTDDKATEANYRLEGTLEIPSGYQAISARLDGSIQNHDNRPVVMTIGGAQPTTVSNSDPVSTFSRQIPLADVRGTVTYAVQSAANDVEMSIVIQVTCQVTPEKMTHWYDQTHAAIDQAYRKQQAAYDEQQAAAAYAPKQLGTFGSSTPARNRNIEREELKRCAASILLRRRLVDLDLGAVIEGADGGDLATPSGYPTPDLDKAQQHGAITRFIEQAFEWDRMGYVFYPYYWGRPATWAESAQLVNQDDGFQAFLRAGYARVVVPVRNAFREAVSYVLTTGELPTSALVPGVGEPGYVDLWRELEAELAQPAERPVLDEAGKPVRWTVEIPTAHKVVQSGLPKDLTPWP